METKARGKLVAEAGISDQDIMTRAWSVRKLDPFLGHTLLN